MSVLPRICIANPTIQILVASSNTTIGELIINFCNNTYENNVITFFWVLKNSIEILGKHIKLCAFDGLFLILLTVVFVLHCTLHLHTILSREIFHIWLNFLLKKLLLICICHYSFEVLLYSEKGMNARYTYLKAMIEALKIFLEKHNL